MPYKYPLQRPRQHWLDQVHWGESDRSCRLQPEKSKLVDLNEAEQAADLAGNQQTTTHRLPGPCWVQLTQLAVLAMLPTDPLLLYFTKSHFEPVLPNFLRLGVNVNIKMVSNTPAALPGKHSHQKPSMHHEPQHFPPSASLLDKVITQTQHLVGSVESFFFDVCLNTMDQQVTAHHEAQLRTGLPYDLPVKKQHKEELFAAHEMAMRRWKKNRTPNCGWTMEELVGAHGPQPELVLLFVGKQEIGKQGSPTLGTPCM